MRRFAQATGLVAVLALGTSLAAAGTINPSFAERFQEVDAIIGGAENPANDNDSDIIFNFAPYNKGLSAGVSTGQIGVDPTNGANSSQVSDIQDETIFGTGSVGANADLSHVFGVAAAGTNTFTVTFDILADVNYTLTGSVDASSSGFVQNTTANVTLTGPGGDLVNISTSNGLSPINSAGLLTAGTYTLSASANVLTNGISSSGSADYDFTLVVPEPTSLMLLSLGMLALRRR